MTIKLYWTDLLTFKINFTVTESPQMPFIQLSLILTFYVAMVLYQYNQYSEINIGTIYLLKQIPYMDFTSFSNNILFLFHHPKLLLVIMFLTLL